MRLIMVAAVAALAGCTVPPTITVKQAPAEMTHVCIETNPRVNIEGFTDILSRAVTRSGRTVEVFSRAKPERCEFVMYYTVRRSWDIQTFLTLADVRIEQASKEVASMVYDQPRNGPTTKWDSFDKLLDPFLDRMLARS
jgi:hypothetical protein